MKSVELDLEKRLLVVEIDESLETLDIYSRNNEPLKKICSGSELTEDLARCLIKRINRIYGLTKTEFWFKNYTGSQTGYFKSAIQSFMCAIESKGYYWGENPINYPKQGSYEALMTTSWEGLNKRFDEAESRTFNPDKTLIFEIL
ncbi:hypothetical protein CEY12_06140 [Chryseobacterium sp. T16E-39]|uniref:hypothetical protein n=1 Tax=Chryseobacterium sp. T16E-39 TaxID=2015076 RepID=UPI000B5B3C70|nr:hypothetical protein [Chryseobacterium sp. T16E-39]ASK29708.1 hypothetical protein CEY12_06140 [Chryseobacterium sp. T16E-39]